MKQEKSHKSVLLLPAVNALNLQPGDFCIDTTMGLGGHTKLMAEQVGANGKILAIERDKEGFEEARTRLSAYEHQVTFVNGDFRDLELFANIYGFGQVQGALFDLGLASWQIDQGYLGLSFQINAPIDMLLTKPRCLIGESAWTDIEQLSKIIRKWRFRPAKEFLNSASDEELTVVLYQLGDIKTSRQLARKIIQQRRQQSIITTFDLKAAIGSNNPKLLAQIWQALRILANDEYGALITGIEAAWAKVKTGGTLAVITFQSDEDRLIKNIFKQLDKKGIIKREKPGRGEVQTNSRSRSATLRTITKI